MSSNNLSFLTYGAIGLTGVILAIATAYDGENGSMKLEEPKEEGPAVTETIASAVGLAPAPPSQEPSEEGSFFGSEEPPREEEPARSDEQPPGQPNAGVFGGKNKRNKNKAKKTKRKRGGKKSRKTKHNKHNKHNKSEK